jgi:hypothetical protein
MTDDKMQPNVNDRPEQVKTEHAGKQMPQSPASAAVLPDQRAGSGRRPMLHLRQHAAEGERDRR